MNILAFIGTWLVLGFVVGWIEGGACKLGETDEITLADVNRAIESQEAEHELSSMR